MEQYYKKSLLGAVKILSKKIVKPMLTLVKRKKQVRAEKKVCPVPPNEEILPIWQHPSDFSNEVNDNTANELLEARLHELIVRECAAVAAQTGAPLSVHVNGHFTVTPCVLPVPVCIVEPTMITTFQKAEGQVRSSSVACECQ